MKVVSFKIDPELKKKMQKFKDINWSEVLREAVKKRIKIEEELRSNEFDRALAIKASAEIDDLRGKTSGVWNGAEEIRKWREIRK
ncbi:MAG: hypothetical protein GF329_01305 [Candidatus Lokiarchaeota archaeon]|nr:hypothetical protein [Candidatus Lokiarchaeota archaeon]